MSDIGDGLEPMVPRYLTGDETFGGFGASGTKLLDYWRWSASCLMDNTARGTLAEFLVATALKGYVRNQPRVEWDAYDFVACIDARELTIEVKSSAKVQSWPQKRHSAPRFGIAPSVKWDPETGEYSDDALRADLYVFCLFAATGIHEHTAALDTDSWLFRVVPSADLPDQGTIAWTRLSQVAGEPCGFVDLRCRIEAVAASAGASRRRTQPSQAARQNSSL